MMVPMSLSLNYGTAAMSEPIPPLKPKPTKMNKTEAAYAQILDIRKKAGEIIRWRFEAVRLCLEEGNQREGVRVFYKPDFMVTMPDCIEIHETKGGFITPAELLRFKIAKSQYPEFRFRMMQYTKKTGWVEIHR